MVLSGPVRLNAHGRAAVRTRRRTLTDPVLELNQEMTRWRRFGPGLARDERGLEVYVQTLMDRDEWQRDLAHLPHSTAVIIGTALVEGDRAFAAATVPDELGLLTPWVDRPVQASWWWTRVPRRGLLLEALHDR